MLNRFFSSRRKRYFYIKGGSDTLPPGWTLGDWTEEEYRRAQFASTQPPDYQLSPDATAPVTMPVTTVPLMSPQELSEALYADYSEDETKEPEDELLVGLQFSENEESSSSSSSSSESSSQSSTDEEFTEPESDFTTESYFSRNQTPFDTP